MQTRREVERQRSEEAIERARKGDFTDLQMGLLDTIEHAPGEVPLNFGLGQSVELQEDLTRAFGPLLMAGLLYVTPSKMLELSEEGQSLLDRARNVRSSLRTDG